MAGVQFKLDGNDLGAADTSAPYSAAWNTASAANGSHRLTAVARDAAGNTTTSAAVDVTVDNGTLTIKGEKKLSNEVKEEQFHRIELRYGTFSRSFSLPQNAEGDKVQASFKDGVLTLRIPKREEAKPRTIAIQSK